MQIARGGARCGLQCSSGLNNRMANLAAENQPTMSPIEQVILDWVNYHLKGVNKKVLNLHTDLQNGLLLLSLASKLTDKSLQVPHASPTSSEEKQENVALAMLTLENDGLRVIHNNDSAKKLVEGDLKFTIEVCKTLILHYHCVFGDGPKSSCMPFSHKKSLLLWLHLVIPDFTADHDDLIPCDWTDGRYLSSLLHYCLSSDAPPTVLSGLSSVSHQACRDLDIPTLLQPSYLTSGDAEFIFMVYLYYFVIAGLKVLLQWVNKYPGRKNAPANDFRHGWSDGRWIYQAVYDLVKPQCMPSLEDHTSSDAIEITELAMAEAKRNLHIPLQHSASDVANSTDNPLLLILFLTQLQSASPDIYVRENPTGHFFVNEPITIILAAGNLISSEIDEKKLSIEFSYKDGRSVDRDEVPVLIRKHEKERNVFVVMFKLPKAHCYIITRVVHKDVFLPSLDHQPEFDVRSLPSPDHQPEFDVRSLPSPDHQPEFDVRSLPSPDDQPEFDRRSRFILQTSSAPPYICNKPITATLKVNDEFPVDKKEIGLTGGELLQVDMLENNVFTVKFISHKTGECVFNFKVGNEAVPDSLKLNIQKPSSTLSDPQFFLQEFSHDDTNCLVQVNLHVKGADLEGFEVHSSSSQHALEAVGEKHKHKYYPTISQDPLQEGQFSICFGTNVADVYMLSVYYYGELLSCCPYAVDVNPKVEVFDPAVIPFEASSSNPVELVLSTAHLQKTTIDDFTVRVSSEATNSIVSRALVQEEPNLFRISFLPRGDDTFRIDITWFCLPIASSSRFITYHRQTSRPSVAIDFQPNMGSKVSVTATVEEAETDNSKLRLPQVAVQQYKRGCYEISLFGCQRKKYHLHVFCSGDEIDGSPFMIELPAFSVNDTDELNDFKISDTDVFSLSVRDKDRNRDQNIPFSFKKTTPELVTIQFKDTERHVYDLRLYWNHVLVKGAPFMLTKHERK